MLRSDNVEFLERVARGHPTGQGRIALSGAGRHLRKIDESSSEQLGRALAHDQLFANPAPLRYLRMFLRNAESEGEATEEMLAALTMLGREMSELLHLLHSHFSGCPDVPASLNRTVGNQTTVNDVETWLSTHLVPLAESRYHALETEIDPVVGLLPTNVLYGLIVEHLRRRVTDHESRSRLRFTVRAVRGGVGIEISEFGAMLPPFPISDESTRMLWARVVHMLQGTIAWRQTAPDTGDEGTTSSANIVHITYPISLASQFEPATQALRSMRNGRQAA